RFQKSPYRVPVTEMRRSDPTILTGWWDFAVRAIALLTTPRADVDRCDRDVATLARTSVVGGALHSVSLATRRAWVASRVHASAYWLASALRPRADAAAWRVAGWMIAVIGATALVVSQLPPSLTGPVRGVVPALLVAPGLLIMAAAAPLARAAADRGRRSSPPS